jgi:hypothetical protein
LLGFARLFLAKPGAMLTSRLRSLRWSRLAQVPSAAPLMPFSITRLRLAPLIVTLGHLFLYSAGWPKP